jgi:hypothetical protein
MEEPKTLRRKVGVYDRPASADRARYIRAVIYVIAIVLGVIGLVFFLMSEADRPSTVTSARPTEQQQLHAERRRPSQDA